MKIKVQLKLVFFLLFLQIPVNAQNISAKVFGAPVMKIGKINNETAVFVGGKAGIKISNGFSVGLAGYGLASKLIVKNENHFNNVSINYGGLFAEYSPFSSQLIHLGAESLIGVGSINISKNSFVKENSETFFLFEPAINLRLNVHKTFKLNIGTSYRITSGEKVPGIGAGEIDGLNFQFSALIGIF